MQPQGLGGASGSISRPVLMMLELAAALNSQMDPGVA